jgi:peptidoglycan/LPS O-acetylase OafA/YrhL
MATTELPTASADPRTSRLPSLTGMRFLAALLVFLCHSSIQGFFADTGLQNGLQTLFIRAGWAGVQFFFVLSGFVLTWSARPTDTVRAFWRRRATKLFPNNLVTCVAAIALMLATGTALSALRIVPNLFLVQSWWPDFEMFDGLNPPSWSLSCELLFYALFPLLLRGVNAIPRRALWPVLGVLYAVILVMPLIASAVMPDAPLLGIKPATSFPQFWLVYAFPVTRVADFTIGIVAARLVATRQWPRVGMLPATLVAVACYAITIVAPVLYSTVATMTIGLVLVIGTSAARDVEGRRSALAGRRMRWLGEVSFALYMVHVLVLTYGHKLIGGGAYSTPVAILVVAVFFLVSLGIAALLFTLVENPAMKRFSRRRKPAPVSTLSEE